MINVTFNKNNTTGINEAIVNGFVGTIQIDAPSKSLISVYAYIDGMKEKQVYAEYANTSIISINFPSEVKLRIEAEEGSVAKYVTNE